MITESSIVRPALAGAIIFLVSFISHGSSAAELDIDQGGNLLGAFDVNVNGSLYNVSFQDGSCVDLFGGCDEPSDFTFTTAEEALAASQALLDEVFIDTGTDNFDSVPNLAVGCESTVECLAITVFQADEINGVSGRVARNHATESEDKTQNQLIGSSTETTQPTLVYAIWQVANEGMQVPIPAGWIALLALTLTGLGITRKRMQHKDQ